jgi:hypothetical protein
MADYYVLRLTVLPPYRVRMSPAKVYTRWIAFLAVHAVCVPVTPARMQVAIFKKSHVDCADPEAITTWLLACVSRGAEVVCLWDEGRYVTSTFLVRPQEIEMLAENAV